jgi:hypothetical protein
MGKTMRALLAPALEQFERLVAAKRAWGATDEDIMMVAIMMIAIGKWSE